jgi:hypothetical protein
VPGVEDHLTQGVDLVLAQWWQGVPRAESFEPGPSLIPSH